MFNRLKDRAKITDQNPSFKAKYVGSEETFTASGKGCTTPHVQRIWDNAQEEQYLPRVQIQITTSGIQMRYLDKKKEPEVLFGIDNISFCNVDSIVNDRIFSWICRDSDEAPLKCHAIVCSTTEKAKSMALVLSRAFQIAYRDWKSTQVKVARENEKQERSTSIKKVSLSQKKHPQISQQNSQNDEAVTSFIETGNGSTVLSNGNHVRPEHNGIVNGIENSSNQKDIATQAEVTLF